MARGRAGAARIISEMPAGLAVFDFDGTLIPNPSSELRFVRFLVRRKRLGFGDLARSIAFAARWWPSYGRHVMKKNKAYLYRIPVTEAESLAREFVPEIVLPLLRTAVMERLRRHQANGDTVALLTGTPDFIAKPICASLGITHCMATVCATDLGRYLLQPPQVHPFGQEKLLLARSLCQKLNCTLSQVSAYGDSIHDRFLLAAAGVAIAVSPDAALAQVARQHNWPVI